MTWLLLVVFLFYFHSLRASDFFLYLLWNDHCITNIQIYLHYISRGYTMQRIFQRQNIQRKTARGSVRCQALSALNWAHLTRRTIWVYTSYKTAAARRTTLLAVKKKVCFFSLSFLPFISFHTTTLWECEGNTNGNFGTTKKLPLLFLWIFSVLFSNPCWFLLLSLDPLTVSELPVGEATFVPNWFGADHHRVERCAVEQRGWPIFGRHLLFLALCAHLGQAHGGNPRVQKIKEDGHNWGFRSVVDCTAQDVLCTNSNFRSLRQD